MADLYGPFDTGVGASWSQDEWYRFAPLFTPSGVLGSPAASSSTGDLALSTSALSLTLGTGRAWVRGAIFDRDAAASVSTTLNGHASWSRRDRLVLRRDLAAKTVTPVVITGTPAASPAAPSINQVETGQWDLLLFSFLVPPNNGTTITGIVDERAWIDAGGSGAQVEATGRQAITVTDKQPTTTALTPVITIPALPVPWRAVFTAMGRSGFDDDPQKASWDWIGTPSSATNVVQDDPLDQVATPDSGWATVVSSLTMDLPAGVAATAQLRLRCTGSVYNRGAVVWHRTRDV